MKHLSKGVEETMGSDNKLVQKWAVAGDYYQLLSPIELLSTLKSRKSSKANEVGHFYLRGNKEMQ